MPNWDAIACGLVWGVCAFVAGLLIDWWDRRERE